jgi:hypothetical protein
MRLINLLMLLLLTSCSLIPELAKEEPKIVKMLTVADDELNRTFEADKKTERTPMPPFMPWIIAFSVAGLFCYVFILRTNLSKNAVINEKS